ncbi:protocadherin alpha-11 isoform X2 [Patella vulgata]|uniref:protocadherin alpha-11 isoform X2 n=1 Tax=Patella vulgata TaxID=6465 RepID=UPI00217F4169|nr:protocadherin alpha-11 isoform X2 [Patella vulgata]
MKVLLIIVVLGFIAVNAQNPCESLDDGPFLATTPTLNIRLLEATKEDLEQYPNSENYRDALRFRGKIGETTPDGITVAVMENFPLIDPRSLVTFETLASGDNIVRLVNPVVRDGPTDDPEDDINFLTFTLKCTPVTNTTAMKFYDVRIQILDINDNYPQFKESPYNITLSELTPEGMSVFTVQATDKDFNLLGNMTYEIISMPGSLTDGSQYFNIDMYTGGLMVKKTLDYDQLGVNNNYLTVRIKVTDGGPNERKSNQTTMTVYITDGNDQGVAYVYQGCFQHMGTCAWPKYTTLASQIKQGQSLTTYPVPNKISSSTKIQARDLDLTLAAEIKFTIASTIPPGSEQKFRVETTKDEMGLYTADVIPTEALPEKLEGFEIFLKAEEQTDLKRHEIAMIYFMDDRDDDKSTSEGQDGDKTPVSKYSEPVLALIIVVSIIAAFLLCLSVAVCCLTKYKSSSPARFDGVEGGMTNGF